MFLPFTLILLVINVWEANNCFWIFDGLIFRVNLLRSGFSNISDYSVCEITLRVFLRKDTIMQEMKKIK